MKTRLKLKPGQKGTNVLVERYGDDFVCVRYRCDEASRTRTKTVELIVERRVLPPSPRKKQIVYGEMELGKLARSAGGRWDADVKLWYIPSTVCREVPFR